MSVALLKLDMHLAADPRNPPKSRNIYPGNDEAGDPLLGKNASARPKAAPISRKNEHRRQRPHRPGRIAIPYERFVAGLSLPRAAVQSER